MMMINVRKDGLLLYSRKILRSQEENEERRVEDQRDDNEQMMSRHCPFPKENETISRKIDSGVNDPLKTMTSHRFSANALVCNCYG